LLKAYGLAEVPSSARRRIAILSVNGTPWGGSEELWFQAALALAAEGAQVRVLKPRLPIGCRRVARLRAAGCAVSDLTSPMRLPRQIYEQITRFSRQGSIVWLMFWAHHVFLGQPTPIEPEAFKLVAALDTVLIVPALVIGGTLLLRRHPWGYVMACAAGVQASLYLIVLFTNAFLFVRLGPADWPGELEIWGPLAASAITVTVWLFSNASQPGEV